MRLEKIEPQISQILTDVRTFFLARRGARIRGLIAQSVSPRRGGIPSGSLFLRGCGGRTFARW